MANTLTNLIPSLYSSLDVVSRELTGFIPAVTLDPVTARAAVGETVYSHVAPAAAAGNITPAATVPDDGDQTIGSVSLSISKARRVPFRWNGEQTLGVNNGPGASGIQANQLQQAIRTLTNEIETDLAALYAGASRAAGATGTTPFATVNDYTAASLARKILVDNGSPQSDLQLVIDTTSGANLRGLQSAVDSAGSSSILRQGVLLDISGMAVRESGQITEPTVGTASSATTDAAGYAIGATVLTLANAGTGTILAGDVITFAGDANQYIVAVGEGTVAAGEITLAQPGLRVAMSAATKAITVVASSPRSMAFHRGAIVLAQRLPALPDGGDVASDRTTIVDPRSGLSFEVAMYPQYRQMQYEVSCAWGVAMVKAEHACNLLG